VEIKRRLAVRRAVFCIRQGTPVRQAKGLEKKISHLIAPYRLALKWQEITCDNRSIPIVIPILFRQQKPFPMFNFLKRIKNNDAKWIKIC
jgi:hypothetical protein